MVFKFVLLTDDACSCDSCSARSSVLKKWVGGGILVVLFLFFESFFRFSVFLAAETLLVTHLVFKKCTKITGFEKKSNLKKTRISKKTPKSKKTKIEKPPSWINSFKTTRVRTVTTLTIPRLGGFHFHRLAGGPIQQNARNFESNHPKKFHYLNSRFDF